MILNLIIAFGAGLISFLSPCVLPLIPGYISYISGQSLNDIVEQRKKVLLKTILFSLGFSLVFIFFWRHRFIYRKFVIGILKFTQNCSGHNNNHIFLTINGHF